MEFFGVALLRPTTESGGTSQRFLRSPAKRDEEELRRNILVGIISPKQYQCFLLVLRRRIGYV